MKVYFGATTSRFPEYKEYYISIRDFLVKEGHVITRDWVQKYKNDLVNNPKKIDTIHKPGDVYGKVIKATYEADVLVFEDTISSFSNGHLMTLALQRKTPVLVLWLEGEKKTYLKKSFIHGIKSDYLQIETYNKDNYKEIITSFINKYEDHYKKHRFHLVIDEAEKRFIEWASHKYDISKTKIIREAIREKLENDELYKDYLSK